MTRREAYESAHAAYIEATRLFLAGMISRTELNRVFDAYESAINALRARRVIH
jgi:hypothetical protein